ncbi:hypothetical protein [Rhodoferax sp.]|uniref:HNH endonuclease n=1 Tax=Rhodoferax sp. TaxID=50421 RepID=UPI00274BF250|nr:hypothetical protein [Rhodoferax sp.]
MKTSIKSLEDARSTIETLIPQMEERALVMGQLLRSAELANELAPNAWGVTSLKNGFRLNVGQVEVLVLCDDQLLFNTIKASSDKTEDAAMVGSRRYSSIQLPHHAFRGAVADFAKVQTNLQAAHSDFILEASRTNSGIPRTGSPFRRFHCAALLDYARELQREPSPESNFDGVWLSQGEMPQADTLYIEGGRVSVQVDKYERNTQARDACKACHGLKCVACEFDFERVYGRVAEGYIHVHHLKPLSEVRESHKVDPIHDMVPVCANCHAVIHLKNPPYTIEEVRNMLKRPDQCE